MSGNTIMTSTTTVEPQYLKVRDKKHDWSNQKLLHHFQHAKNQLNSSIYSWDKTDFRVPGQTYFYRHIWPDPITIKVTFSFPDYIWACKKSAYFINSFLRCKNFRVPWPKRPHILFDHAYPITTGWAF